MANINSYTYNEGTAKDQLELYYIFTALNFIELACKAKLKQNGALPPSAGQVSLTLYAIKVC